MLCPQCQQKMKACAKSAWGSSWWQCDRCARVHVFPPIRIDGQLVSDLEKIQEYHRRSLPEIS